MSDSTNGRPYFPSRQQGRRRAMGAAPGPPPIDLGGSRDAGKVNDAATKSNDPPWTAITSPWSFISDGAMAEATFDPTRYDRLVYAMYSVEGATSVGGALTIAGREIGAPEDVNGLIGKRLILFPSEPTEYGSDTQLDSDIGVFIRRYADVPDLWVDLMRAYAKMTWVFERFGAIPYLRFLGEPGSGKTRLAQVVAHLCYRTVIGGGATSSAPFFRLMELFRGTFFLDEADYRDSDLWTDIIKILNGGYKRGLPVWRCDKDNQPEAFDAFGPKIITTRKRFQDAATESRCITLETREGAIRDDILRQLPDSFYLEARELRNKLLMWRFRNYRGIKLDESRLRMLDSRMTEIATPLVAVSSNPAFTSRVVEFCGKCIADQRADRPQAFIIEAIRSLVGESTHTDLFVKEVAQRASELRQGEEPVAARLTRPATGDEPQYFSAKRAGHLIRTLGFETVRIGCGYKFEVTAAKVAELRDRYGSTEDRKEEARPKSHRAPLIGTYLE